MDDEVRDPRGFGQLGSRPPPPPDDDDSGGGAAGKKKKKSKGKAKVAAPPGFARWADLNKGGGEVPHAFWVISSTHIGSPLQAFFPRFWFRAIDRARGLRDSNEALDNDSIQWIVFDCTPNWEPTTALRTGEHSPEAGNRSVCGETALWNEENLGASFPQGGNVIILASWTPCTERCAGSIQELANRTGSNIVIVPQVDYEYTDVSKPKVAQMAMCFQPEADFWVMVAPTEDACEAVFALHGPTGNGYCKGIVRRVEQAAFHCDGCGADYPAALTAADLAARWNPGGFLIDQQFSMKSMVNKDNATCALCKKSRLRIVDQPNLTVIWRQG